MPRGFVSRRPLCGRLGLEPRDSDGVFAAAGGLYTSLRDYARYLSYQLAAYPPRDDPESGPVRRSTLREMHEGQRLIRSEKDTPFVRVTDDGPVLGVASYGFGWARAVLAMIVTRAARCHLVCNRPRRLG